MNFQYPEGVHAPRLNKPKMSMTPHQYGWADAQRLRNGALWRSERPGLSDYPNAPKYFLLLLLIVILFSWASDREYAYAAESVIDEQVAKTEEQARIAEERANDLGRCIQGNLRLMHDNETGKGYSKTVINCKKAEEFNV